MRTRTNVRELRREASISFHSSRLGCVQEIRVLRILITEGIGVQLLSGTLGGLASQNEAIFHRQPRSS